MTAESLVGRELSHYRITRRLGAGGMGIVYEAEDTRLGRRVAVKFLSEELQLDAPMLERFEREARAASALSHPGICTVHAIEQHEGRSFIVMELLEGSTLAERMGARRFEIGELVEVGLQIADALESAHAKGIVHRDLKPVNLFLTARGPVKILDFGLAKFDRVPTAAEETLTESVAKRQRGGDLTVAGTVLGTVHYMSPEQARGQFTDTRTDLFSLGAVLYQMATGSLPFPGETQAIVFDGILNRESRPLSEAAPEMPPALGQILEKALEKDRDLRYQTATDLKTDLARLKQKLGAKRSNAADVSDSKAPAKRAERSVAVLYFENLSGSKEDDYLRDGITEDLITDLSKIRGLDVFPRTTVLGFRDRPATAEQVCRQLHADYALEGSLRRAGNRLRINAQLVDAASGFPAWSERYDREISDIFEVQDEIAQKIAEALRITLSPQERADLAARPTEDLQAYDLFLRGKSYARRLTRQDTELALSMFEKAVALDPGFALAHAAIANVYARYHYIYARDAASLERAREAAARAMALSPQLAEARVANGFTHYNTGEFEKAIAITRDVVARQPDCEGAYYLLLRSLFASGRYQEIVEVAEAAIAASGADYNVYVPIANSLNALGKTVAAKNFRLRRIQAMETHLQAVPDDARARMLAASDYAAEGRGEEAVREMQLAVALRPNDASMLYNAACTYCLLNRKDEALDTLEKAWAAGYRDGNHARRDPDLTLLRGDSRFERLYPEAPADG